MKRLFALLLSFVLVFITSCTREASAEAVLRELCRVYPINAVVYSSRASEYEDGYISEDMLVALYGESDIPASEIAVVMYGDVGAAREIGAFTVRTGSERMRLFELATERINFLSSFVDGEGFVKKYHGVMVYGFVDDALSVERVLDSLLG